MIVRRPRTAALLAAFALSSALACKLEPDTPELHYSLNGAEIAKNNDLASDAAAQVQLEGAL